MKTEEKRLLINKQEREDIKRDLETLKIVISVIKHSKDQKMPHMSLLHLVELKETLEEIVLKDGLPQKRLKEIKKEFLKKKL